MKGYLKRYGWIFLSILLTIAILGGTFTTTVIAAQQYDLLVMSSVIGGIGFQYSSGVAKVLTAAIPDARVTMEATSGYIDNARLLHAGFGDLGIIAHNVARAVYFGGEGFEKKGTPLVCISPIHVLYWNFIVEADSPIKTVWDLEGKRVNLQPKGSSSEATATELFNALNINIKPSYYRHSEAAEAMRSGAIDAHWLGGSNPVWMQYSVRTPIRVLKFSDEDIAKICEKLPFLSPVIFPAEDYYKGAGEVKTLGTWALLMCRKDLSVDLVYQITKGIYEHKDIMLAAHPGAKDIGLDKVLELTVPYHPGAIKYYEEEGIKIPKKLIP